MAKRLKIAKEIDHNAVIGLNGLVSDCKFVGLCSPICMCKCIAHGIIDKNV